MVSLAIETHGWSEEEAVDWIYYNTLPSLRRDEPTCPIVMHLIIQGGDKVWAGGRETIYHPLEKPKGEIR